MKARSSCFMVMSLLDYGSGAKPRPSACFRCPPSGTHRGFRRVADPQPAPVRPGTVGGPARVGETRPPLALETAQERVSPVDRIQNLPVPGMHEHRAVRPGQLAAARRHLSREARVDAARDRYCAPFEGLLKEAVQHFAHAPGPRAELQHLADA